MKFLDLSHLKTLFQRVLDSRLGPMVCSSRTPSSMSVPSQPGTKNAGRRVLISMSRRIGWRPAACGNRAVGVRSDAERSMQKRPGSGLVPQRDSQKALLTDCRVDHLKGWSNCEETRFSKTSC